MTTGLDPRIMAWVCTAKVGHPHPPEPVVVYAARRAQAVKIAYNHGPGFDMVDYIDIRCRRFPVNDGNDSGFGMYDPETGEWIVESFRRFYRNRT